MAERVKLLGYIQSLIPRHNLAEDIFQDVCAASFRKRAMIADEFHLRHWLRVSARRQAMNVLRKRQESCVSLDRDVADLLDPVWREHDGADSTGRAEALRNCLSLLSKPHQELVQKRFAENYDYPRLAAEFNRSVQSVYVTFSRIYTTLGKCISARLDTSARGANAG